MSIHLSGATIIGATINVAETAERLFEGCTFEGCTFLVAPGVDAHAMFRACAFHDCTEQPGGTPLAMISSGCLFSGSGRKPVPDGLVPIRYARNDPGDFWGNGEKVGGSNHWKDRASPLG